MEEDLKKLKEFAKFIIKKSWQDLDVDGSDIHEKALELGLIGNGHYNDDDDYIYELMDIVK